MAGNLTLFILSLFIVYTAAQLSSEKTEDIKSKNSKEHKKGCGWRIEDGIGFKINLEDNNIANYGEFPWMVAIFASENSNKRPNCGGSLIAPNVVLTAALCVPQNEEIIVRGGEYDYESENEILKHVDIAVKEIILHENINKKTGYNGIALLILKESFVWGEHIRPICLPETNATFDGQRCFVTGWGKFAHDDKYQVVLNKLDLPVVPRDTCQNNLRQTHLGLHYNLHESFMCAGGEKGKDICLGGGGSPLVCPIPGFKGRYYQVGIVSSGVGCGLENVPGLYVNVTYFRDWISEKLNSQKIPFEHFTP